LRETKRRLGSGIPASDSRFPAAEDCWRALERARWPLSVQCPRCPAKAHPDRDIYGPVYRTKNPRVWRCRECAANYAQRTEVFTVLNGTPAFETKLSLGKWFWGMLTISDDTPIRVISAQLDVHKETATSLKPRLIAMRKIEWVQKALTEIAGRYGVDEMAIRKDRAPTVLPDHDGRGTPPTLTGPHAAG